MMHFSVLINNLIDAIAARQAAEAKAAEHYRLLKGKDRARAARKRRGRNHHKNYGGLK